MDAPDLDHSCVQQFPFIVQIVAFNLAFELGAVGGQKGGLVGVRSFAYRRFIYMSNFSRASDISAIHIYTKYRRIKRRRALSREEVKE